HTNAIAARIPVQNGAFWISAGAGSAWVQGWSKIVRIDASGRRSHIPFSSNFRPFAYGEGGVWFVGDAPGGMGSLICRFKASTLRVDSCVDAGSVGDLEGSHPVFVLDRRARTIWVSNFRHTITRIALR